MNWLWVIIYSAILYPLLFLLGVVGSFFNKKIRDGISGRMETLSKLELFFKSVDRRIPVYWFHAASHGEFEQIRPVLAGLKEVEPSATVVVSFFSPSGFKNVKDGNIDCAVYLPFDFIWSVRKALKIVRPRKLIFAAYDIWPNLIWVARRRGIHTNIFAARVKKGTKKLYPLIKLFYRSVYRSLASIYTISEEDYIQLQRLIKRPGNPVIRVLGNPRYDQVKQHADTFTQKRTVSVLLRENRLIAGSVHSEDTAVILDPILRLMEEDESLCVLWVPHEPTERNIDPALSAFGKQGWSVRTLGSSQSLDLRGYRVVVVDRIGVLSRLYWQGQIAYVGGGFSTGIHNVMEPAIARLPVLFGPRYSHANEADELINAGGGFNITDSESFYRIMKNLLEDKNLFLKASYAATDVIHNNLGSSTRIVRSIIRD